MYIQYVNMLGVLYVLCTYINVPTYVKVCVGGLFHVNINKYALYVWGGGGVGGCTMYICILYLGIHGWLMYIPYMGGGGVSQILNM